MQKKQKLFVLLFYLTTTIIAVRFLYTFFMPEYADESDLVIRAEQPDYEELVFEKEYGVAVDSFHIERGSITRNQNLSNILSEYNVSRQTIHNISLLPNEIFDARRMRAGNNYAVFVSADSTETAHYFIYEEDPVKFVRIKLTDSISVARGKKIIDPRRKTTSGYIKTSLWNTVTDSGSDPMIAILLSEIFAWSFDFFRLQKDDHFKIIYDENYVDSNRVGIGKIHAAYFNHRGKSFYAIPFEQDSVLSFYDTDGNSLRRTFLKAPLRFNRVSSGFSHSRMHPVLGVYRPHLGIDYAAPSGTPVYAIGDGVVVETTYRSAEGRMIRIRHNSVYTSGYLHLRNFAQGIKPGVKVEQGEVIGYVGATGLATGPHLDFRMWRNGQLVNPLSIESPPVEPVRKEKMGEFYKVSEKWLRELDMLVADQ